MVEFGDLAVESGDFMVEAGDFMVEAGDLLIEAGDFMVEAGDLLVETGYFLFKSGESLFETGHLLVESIDFRVDDSKVTFDFVSEKSQLSSKQREHAGEHASHCADYRHERDQSFDIHSPHTLSMTDLFRSFYER